MTTTDRPPLRLHEDLYAKHVTRVREAHVATLMELAKRCPKAVLLDLTLRAAGLLPAHMRARQSEPGIVVGCWAYEDLAEVIRGDRHLGVENPVRERAKQREFVRRQIAILEDPTLNLIRRDSTDPSYGNRPRLYVLRDDGTGEPLDDPGDGDDPWIAIPNAPIAAGLTRGWGTPEVVAFLAAMVGERFERYDNNAGVGDRIWWRSHEWFIDPTRPPAHHTRAWPISSSTLYKGLRLLQQAGLVHAERRARNPATGRRFPNGPRNIYTNRFVTDSAPLLHPITHTTGDTTETVR